jgi:spore coat polysaccharide biosynthesis protein SpsF (cytidylyltransferase family)
MSSTGIVVQARLGSTRLPGKVMLPFHEGKSILKILVDRIRQYLPESPLIIATSVHRQDHSIEEFCSSERIKCFRGSEDDVLARFIGAAESLNLTNVVRVCADNPFLLGDQLVELFNPSEGPDTSADYISFRDSHGTPSIKTHWGLFAERVSVAALKAAELMTTLPLYHEHVTNFVYGNPDKFRITLIPAPSEIYSRDDLRFTVDTALDFDSLKELYRIVMERNMSFSLKDLILLVDELPEIRITMREGISNFKK